MVHQKRFYWKSNWRQSRCVHISYCTLNLWVLSQQCGI